MLETTEEQPRPGKRLRVARLGQGEAVLLLHGYPDNLQVFSQLAPGLAPDKRVIAFDWPGMGDSDDWGGGATPLLVARRLLQLLDAWQLDKVHLVGQDMGGQPALVFAAVYPERVRSVVVMNSLVNGDADTSWEIKWLRRFGVNKLLLARFPWLVFQRARYTFLPRGVAIDAAVQRDMWRTFRQPAVRQFIVRMCAGYEGQLKRLPEWYRQITCPVLILWAEKDKHFPVSQARSLQQHIPHARLRILPGAGHWMVLHQAAETAAAIREFYREVKTGETF
ncbi:alpha/beta hydrolase [Hymenobacter sp. BT635]|uniref:Alpha/beta hydrolase n=1 Tax=Hymenobacter nitidus TaxID=2880929 RepID=A0ABS8ADL2_9BACT|nr:alpha/beta hydrolase [Hymenobacter nitidus]MCB2377991.1 alpha/beta hydrolase [Hymenobacter nitidus]